MNSKILTKLIDKAILPAITLFATRIISVVLVSRYLDLKFTFSISGFSFDDKQSYVIANSYSTLMMLVILTLGLIFVLVKTYVFHETHIKPPVTAKLFDLRIPSLIQSSLDLYSQATIWLSYSYLILLVSGVMMYFGLIYKWVFFTSLVVTIIVTILLVFDVENEIKNKKKETEYDQDSEFVQKEDEDL